VVCSQREVEKKVGILRQFAAGFTDYRNTDLIEHRMEELVAQRVHSLALGYEDLKLPPTGRVTGAVGQLLV